MCSIIQKLLFRILNKQSLNKIIRPPVMLFTVWRQIIYDLHFLFHVDIKSTRECIDVNELARRRPNIRKQKICLKSVQPRFAFNVWRKFA